MDVHRSWYEFNNCPRPRIPGMDKTISEDIFRQERSPFRTFYFENPRENSCELSLISREMAEAENFTIGCRSRQSSEKSKIFFEEETSCYDYVAQLTHSAPYKSVLRVEDFCFF